VDDALARRFFLGPSCPRQRQDEALRAVFLDGLSQKDAARRYPYPPGAFRLVVQQFRAARAVGAVPPFLPSRAGDGRPPRPPEASHPRRASRASRRSPTPGR
jgi:hypothetical protein